ncbi:MAG: sugar phosphate nucleotidyltransferase [Syntrophobacterales bacterium]
MTPAMKRLKGLTTIIMAGGRGERLFPLTRDKAKPAIIFGGTYRIIDFTLSNCLNSGIRNIYVLSQYGSFSLDIHLRLTWDILRPDLGEYIYSVPPQQITVNRWYRGTADSIYQNLNLLEYERPRQVLILSGDHVYKMDYLAMLDFHLAKDADLTVAAVPAPRREASAFGILHVDADSRVIDFLEKPAEPPAMPGHPDFSLVSMGVYIFKAEVLVQEVIADAKSSDSKHDFGRNIIPRMVGKKRSSPILSRTRRPANPRTGGTSAAWTLISPRIRTCWALRPPLTSSMRTGPYGGTWFPRPRPCLPAIASK